MGVNQLFVFRASLDAAAAFGGQPIHDAAELGHAAVVEMLADKLADLSVADKNGTQPIHSASYAGHVMMVKLLATRRVGIAVKDKRDAQPLDIAAQRGHRALIRLLKKLQKSTVSAARVYGKSQTEL